MPGPVRSGPGVARVTDVMIGRHSHSLARQATLGHSLAREVTQGKNNLARETTLGHILVREVTLLGHRMARQTMLEPNLAIDFLNVDCHAQKKNKINNNTNFEISKFNIIFFVK